MGDRGGRVCRKREGKNQMRGGVNPKMGGENILTDMNQALAK